ncbi:MAG: 50S ribosome-binding GTPase [Albidovulum sp.]|nr:50S ribosome-binding GTPase [Albidovulum sp.]
MKRYWERIWNSIERKEKEAPVADEFEGARLPTLWMLGKTGAGKSSIIKLITGATDIEIGNGFEPCTRHARFFRFPQDEPVLRFLDTRGIGEEGFDLVDGIEKFLGATNAILAVARIDDPAQGELVDAVRVIRKSRRKFPIFVVHNRADAVSDKRERERIRDLNHRSIEAAARRRLPMVEVGALDRSGADEFRDRLLELLEVEMPLAAFVMSDGDLDSADRWRYGEIRTRIARYSLLAGASGWVPIGGAAAVPAIQGRMLFELADHYDVALNKEVFVALVAALGTGTAASIAGGHLLRQAGTLVPGIGQTAGAALAGAAAFASTFAIGSAAGYYFHQLNEGISPDREEVRRIYKAALRNARNTYKPDR